MSTTLEEFLDEFEANLANPLSYLEPSDELRTQCIHGVKTLFDLYKKQCNDLGINVCTGPLDELYTEGFDNEQIWAEIELMNEPALKSIKKHIKKMSVHNMQSASEASAVDDDHTDGTAALEEEEQPWESDGESEGSDRGGESVDVRGRRSVVDDQFFCLADMEKFLEQTERREELERDSDGTDSEEEVDYFADEDVSDSDTEKAHYGDFFDPPYAESAEVRGGGVDEVGVASDDDDEMGVASDDDESGATSDDDTLHEDSTSTHQPLSSHERKQLKIKQRISELEEINLGPRPWQLAGEASSKGRPLNSLLAEDLSFDHMSRPAPVVTEETTRTLEDIIKQRIKDEAWDDVERKVKPTEKPYDYSRSRPLDQEKSKLSLAEVYEQEYIKQTQVEEEAKEDERHTEIRELMKKLFVKLDALSNFHFTPKPPKPDVTITTNVPAIQMEEVAPVATSDAARLAPEEIQPKSHRPEIGATEKTTTDKKHDRRLKKRRKRLQLAERKQREKVIAKLRPGLGNKFTRRAMEKRLKEREQDEAVDKTLRSSSRFFAKLQEQVKEQVKTVKGGKEEKNCVS